jgi:transcriptional regulator with XRE-family HTH domain
MGLTRRKGPDFERLLDQERLILDATEAVVAIMEDQNVSRKDLARRLGKSKGLVSQLLSGERNMTLRTLSDLGHALGYRFSVHASPAVAALEVSPPLVFGKLRRNYEPREARHILAPRVVEESVSAAEAASDSHEYALAA